uniref:L1 transposable element RRM domain-containing protein n=1 Tax=Photinus pyralis TaxID=7054 RepID=A0A1Y1MUD8_PHOPY
MEYTREQKMEISTIIKESITALLEDRDFMDKLAAKVAMSIEKKLEDFKIQTEGRLNNLKKENVKLATELDELKQYSRRNNIRVFGIPETSGENVEDKFLSVTKDRMSIVLMPNEIERCHRIGKKINNKPRPVIIKFMSYKTKALLYLNKKLLKGTGITLREDLTSDRAKLYKLAVDKYGFNNVWTYDGVIKLKLKNTIQSIRSADDIGLD